MVLESFVGRSTQSKRAQEAEAREGGPGGAEKPRAQGGEGRKEPGKGNTKIVKRGGANAPVLRIKATVRGLL